MSNDLLQKVVDTTQIGAGGGGILQPEQANRFIDYMWDATTLGQFVRRIRMNADTVEIDKIDLGERIARLATEGVDDHELARPEFTKIELRTRKIRLDWELTSEGLEDNLAGDDLEDHIARLMATQLGNDLEDLAINGDVDSTHPLMKAFDGYLKLFRNNAHILEHDVDAAPDDNLGMRKEVFDRAYKALPRRYKQRRNELRFFTSSGLVHDYMRWLSNERDWDISETLVSSGQFGPSGGPGATPLQPFGIPLVEVPLQREDLDATADNEGTGEFGYVLLTFPRNHLWGVKREITVYREFKPKKDAIEYTVFTRVGVQVDHPDAAVLVRNIQNQSP